MRNIKIFSFFSGSGLLDLGFEHSSYNVEFVNEYSEAFISAYKYSRDLLNIKEPKYGYHQIDINEFLEAKSSELVSYMSDARKDDSLVGFIGGPPCPDFSVGGKNKGRDGDNGKLSSAYVELIVNQSPDFFLFENVKGLWRTKRHREYYEELKLKLHEHGYCTTERLTNALEYGVPQDRDRILLFGVKSELLSVNRKSGFEIIDFPWTKEMKYNLNSIKEINWVQNTPFVLDSSILCPKDAIQELTVEYWFMKNDVLNHPNSDKCFIPRNGLQKMLTVDEGDVSKKSYKRLHRWRYAPTSAYGNNEVHLHPYKARRISVAEALAVQSLPAEFALPNSMTLSNMFKTIGNGVPYLLALGISKTIKDYLEDLL